ncbi:DUF2793 domain-containing protein [Aureimonas sp. ME7]|uniref:DUF2793 domain-containing protein n=1 Tax=Aureimonas sp. ME7 TaxID=2744252 RepID=UPI0015F66B49|nr:DUF2793 domain-containing protein [Aureimonas sp. ME7]
MSTSPRLSLPLLMPQQAQRHLTLNDAFRLLDVFVQTAVVSAERIDEPEAGEEGQLFILPDGASGLRWSAMTAGSLALFENGGFVEIRPVPGQIAFVADRRALLLFDGDAWVSDVTARDEWPAIGVNAAPSAGNRLTVAADAELLTFDNRTPGSGDARKVINKSAQANVASVLFQTAFAGRGEIGLLGNDALTFRVSADGGSFRAGLRLEGASGHVSVASESAPVCALDVAGPVRVARYAKAALPAATAGAGQIVFVSDDAGGAVLAFSDGAAWRRVTDRAIVM